MQAVRDEPSKVRPALALPTTSPMRVVARAGSVCQTRGVDSDTAMDLQPPPVRQSASSPQKLRNSPSVAMPHQRIHAVQTNIAHSDQRHRLSVKRFTNYR